MFTNIALFLKAVNPRTWIKIFISVVITASLCLLIFKVYQYGESNQAKVSAQIISDQQKTIDALKEQIIDANAMYAQQLKDNSDQYHAWQVNLQEAKNEAAKEIAHAKAISATTTIINSQLRKSLDTTQIKLSNLPNTEDARAASNEYTAVLSASFADCTGKYQQMAELATGYQIDAKLLYDSWPITTNNTTVSSDDEQKARADSPPSAQ